MELRIFNKPDLGLRLEYGQIRPEHGANQLIVSVSFSVLSTSHKYVFNQILKIAFPAIRHLWQKPNIKKYIQGGRE